MTQQSRNCVPTKWDSINEIMDGGLAGRVRCDCSLEGIGKSWTLQADQAVKITNTLLELTTICWIKI